ncbi:MAG: sulfotransferase family protein [Patescibacteria group bacterium]
MTKPNFFIIGAPRSGTTFMQKNLDDHPDIFMAPGEPSYFCPDYVDPWLSEEAYFDLFEEAQDCKIKGEKTVFYLPSKVAIKNIFDFNSDSKLLVMLRNPVEAAYSFHSKMLSVGRETIGDFEKAWKLQEKRSEDKFYRGKLKISTLFYGEVYKLGKHLKRVYDIFPEEQVKVVIFDNFIEDEKTTYKEVLDFLNLDSDFEKSFTKVNSHSQPKSKLVNRLLGLRGIFPVQKTKKMLKINGQIGFLSKIKKLNQTSKERKPLPEEFKKELSNYFKEDVELLSKILDKDLTDWLEG